MSRVPLSGVIRFYAREWAECFAAFSLITLIAAAWMPRALTASALFAGLSVLWLTVYGVAVAAGSARKPRRSYRTSQTSPHVRPRSS